jgi:predicted dehydrogenase
MAERIRIGVAGLGRIGWNFHCRQLAGHERFLLAGVADPDAERCQEAVATYGCRAFATFADLLTHAELDAVVIATPTHLHTEMVKAATAKGLHVLLEKPMAPTLGEAREIAQAAQNAGTILTVYQPHRHSAYFQHLKAIVDSGRIGRVYWVQRGAFNYARRNDWQALLKYGGGMLSNYGAHYLDQILQLVGYDVKRVFCNLQLVASLGDAEDVVKVVLETEQGVLGECTINQASTIRPYDFLVWGTHGAVSFAQNRFRLRWFEPDSLPPKQLDPSLSSEGRKYPSDAIDYHEEDFPVDPSYAVDVFANLADAIQQGHPVAVPPAETLALMEVTERCRTDSGGIRHAPSSSSGSDAAG